MSRAYDVNSNKGIGRSPERSNTISRRRIAPFVNSWGSFFFLYSKKNSVGWHKKNIAANIL